MARRFLGGPSVGGMMLSRDPVAGDEPHVYRLTFTFPADFLTVRLLSWVVWAYSHEDAPDNLTVRFERVD